MVFSVEVDNTETNKQLGAVTVQLVADYKFTSRRWNSKLPLTEVVSTVCLAENVQEWSVAKWTGVSMEIPSDTTPSFSISSGIHLEYRFVFYVVITSALTFPEIKFPVVISSGLETSQPSGSTSLIQGNVDPGAAQDHTPNSPSAQADMPGTIPTDHHERSGYLLTTITQQPSGDIPDQPPPPYPTKENE